MSTAVAQSWSGSESRRRPQGGCKPPSHTPDHTQRYTVPTGTKCRVRHVSQSESQFQAHTTRQPLGFARYETCDRKRWVYTFRQECWLVEVACRLVQKRTRSPLRGGR